MIDRVLQIKRKIAKRIKKPELSKFPDLPYPTVDFVFWRGRNFVNFGDECGRAVVELMLSRRGMTIYDEVKIPRSLMAVGSILHFATDNTVVWGSGRHGNHPDSSYLFKHLDVRAVRGPRTRDFLLARGISVPEVYGDPALLLPMLTQDRFNVTREFEVGFVPHLHDYKKQTELSRTHIPILDPRKSWNKMIADILRYKFVLSNSLHGLILAEAYGIPARFVRLTEHEGLLKYHDYYEGTGREMGQYARSIAEGLEMGGKEPPQFDAAKLMDAFPYDIWE